MCDQKIDFIVLQGDLNARRYIDISRPNVISNYDAHNQLLAVYKTTA